MHTNRNGLERQIINEWKSNKGRSDIFIETLGKEDSINQKKVTEIQSLIENDLVDIAKKYRQRLSKYYQK